MWNPGILQYVCFFKEFLTYKIENCFCEYRMTKIIKGEVVTEISSFISRHIFAKLAEFYFHTYGFFSLKIDLILYQSALKNNF